MYVSKLEINKFRRFKDFKIKLGKHITCLAGHNAVGKSTLLGLLGHCGEYKKQDGQTLFGHPFRADLSEIIKFSKEFDSPGSDLFTIHFNELPSKDVDINKFPSSLSFRTTWQAQKDKVTYRYRILPMKKDERITEKKIPWPTFYLGLSRLYPLGESSGINKTKLNSNLTTSEVQFIFEEYKNILTSNDSYKEVTSFVLSEIKKKKSIGVNTEFYDYLSNSAGQDNLGQILIALLSFKKIKAANPDNWNGGLLLIDEIDATLHPAAQNKLLDLLLKESKKLGIQIVFTTHSLSLLEHIHMKCKFNKPEEENQVELCYLTTANDKLTAFSNPTMDSIYYDLMTTYHGLAQKKEILVYSEDDETRWFFKKILEFSKNKNLIEGNIIHRIINHLSFLEIKLGCDQLLTLLSQDFNYFSKCIMLLDGDVSEDQINKKLAKVPVTYSEDNYENNKVLIKLPCAESPEQIIWNYLNNLDEDSGFFTEEFFYMGYSKRNLINHGPFSNDYSGKDRERYKQWFNNNIYIVEAIMNFWLVENEDIIITFLKKLEPVYNFAANKNNIATVKYGHSLLSSKKTEGTSNNPKQVIEI